MNKYVDEANKYYADALLAMQNHESVASVRNLLIKVTETLNKVAVADPSMANKAGVRIRFLLNIVKDIRENKSYENAYYKLTGSYLPKEEKVTTTKTKPVLENKIETKDDSFHKFNWDVLPEVSFEDVAGLDDVKKEVFNKVIQPLTNPSLYEGYDKKSGGGLLLYGPPGTGKTMIAAAIAREIGAKFCTVGPSDLLSTGVGNSEKAISRLFEEARKFKCAVIFFDEMESLCPATTHAQVARQVRSELLRQIQGLNSYAKDTGNILYLIGATNKPWDVDPAFIRPGRFGTRVYVGLPDQEARLYMIKSKLEKIKESGKVEISDDINFEDIVSITEGFNGADMSYLLNEVQELSISRASLTGEKTILNEDFVNALNKVTSSVQKDDINKLLQWKEVNG